MHACRSTLEDPTLTPAVAVLALGGVTALATCLGDAILVPITEVGSMASALGWLAACAAFYVRRPGTGDRVLALTGMGVALLLVLMKLLPVVPGHFTRYEWIAFVIWAAAGLAVRRRAPEPAGL